MANSPFTAPQINKSHCTTPLGVKSLSGSHTEQGREKGDEWTKSKSTFRLLKSLKGGQDAWIFGKLLPFFCDHRGEKATRVLLQSYVKQCILHKALTPTILSNSLVFRPASSKWPATSDFMKSFWFRPDSNSLIKVPLIPLNLANSYEYFFSTLRPVLSPGPQTTVSLCLNGASNKYLNSCSEYRISPCEPWPFGKTLDQCSVTVTRLHSLQIWKG